MKIGYARVSIVEEASTLGEQIERLKAEGCPEVFSETTDTFNERPELEAAFGSVSEGDQIIITSLDRLARNTSDLWDRIEYLREKGVVLIVVDIGLDTATRTGRTKANAFGHVAELERQGKKERHRLGVMNAKKAGKFKGRQRTIMPSPKAERIRELHAAGKTTQEIMREVGCSRATVYNHRKKLT